MKRIPRYIYSKSGCKQREANLNIHKRIKTQARQIPDSQYPTKQYAQKVTRKLLNPLLHTLKRSFIALPQSHPHGHSGTSAQAFPPLLSFSLSSPTGPNPRHLFMLLPKPYQKEQNLNFIIGFREGMHNLHILLTY